jgi:hypothetical protein
VYEPGGVAPFGPLGKFLQPATPTARKTTAAIAGIQRRRCARANIISIRSKPSNDPTGIISRHGPPRWPQNPAGGVELQNVTTEMPVFTAPLPVNVTLVGVTVQVIVLVLGAQVKLTVPVAPSDGVSTIGNTAVSPGLTVAVEPPLPPTVSVKDAAPCVVPLSETVCGLPVALSLSVNVPLLGEVPVGVNVTLTAHDWPGASKSTGQVPPLTTKGPLAVMLENSTLAVLLVLVLFTVTVIGLLVVLIGVAGKVRVCGETVMVMD